MVRAEQTATLDTIAGRYEVEEVLGRGGMGAVYRVRDRLTGRSCALKRGWASDGRDAQRRSALLEREYHTLAQLAHPRIIEVYEYGITAEGPYYTMELLEGADLDKTGRLPWKEACALLCDVASSLAVLHARGLIHRDVSARNVRRTPEGRAKLIDFGAMAAIGAAKDVVGTPPFMAPEVLQMQELDARAELFSLGALGYYMLTGRNAYPARRLSDLRDVWRSRPVAPARIVTEVPEGLSALIMQLLALDRSARPKSAAEVMERLSALAGLPMEAHVEVSRAYLTTPTLVGREQALVRARRQMLSLARGDGGSLLIDGVVGSGRSRMLDACVLEGKLLGATVLRANAGDAVAGDWGVARAICARLIELMPNEAADAARLSQSVLAHVIDGLVPEPALQSAFPERSLLLRELRDFVLALSRAQRLLLVVDDVDKIDEPSAALLAAIANKADRHALLSVLSVEREPARATSASLRLLRLVSQTIELDALPPEQTATLVRSIFGDVPNVELVGGRIDALTQGNPRATMDLVQHLVERGLARYEAGSWLLPSQLDDDDLPNSIAAALAGRLSALSADARALCDVHAVADGDALSFGDYPELAGIGDHKRVFAALDELLAARVLVADGASYRLGQRAFLALLQASTSAQRRQTIHARIADSLARRGGDVTRRAHHLLSADRDHEAIELLNSIDLKTQTLPVAVLEKAIERAALHAFPRRTLHELRMALLIKASVVLAVESFRKHLPPVLEQLERDSGLRLYRELSELPAEERLRQALGRAQERHLAAAESERVHAVLDAIRELGRLVGATCAFSMQLFDLELLESMPSLEPLIGLSPALAVVDRIVLACKEWMVGRHQRHREIADGVLERIGRADRGGLEEGQHQRTRYGLLYGLGLFEAALGTSGVEARAQQLESQVAHRVNAWRIRMLLHVSQGNVEEARRCERRAELMQLQQSGEQSYLGMGVGIELMALAELGDLLGVKSRLDAISVLAERHPAWQRLLAYGQSRYRWLQGDISGALEITERALQIALPGRHNTFFYLAGLHVRLLGELGRFEQAVNRGREYLAITQREALVSPDYGLFIGLSKALTATGAYAEALATIEPVIANSEKLGRAGLALGVLYETRARIALSMHDGEAFERFSEKCASEYKKARNPVLGARFAQLLEAASQQALPGFEPSADARALMQLPAPDSEYDTVHSRILECIDDSDRARCALTLLLQSTDSGIGYLYGVRDGRPELLAALPEPPPDDGLANWVNASLQAEISPIATVTADAREEQARSGVSLRYIDAEGRYMRPIFLIARQPATRVAAVLVLHMTNEASTPPPRPLLEDLANELLDHGDVSGMQIEEVVTR